MKKKFMAFILAGLMILSLAGCASLERGVKDISSDFGGGLDRTIKIYSMTGELIAIHSGKTDIEDRENSILFELDGKRYVYYNAIIEVIEN